MKIILILVLTVVITFIACEIYEPKIDIVINPIEKKIVLWYNLFINGKPTGRKKCKTLIRF